MDGKSKEKENMAGERVGKTDDAGVYQSILEVRIASQKLLV